MTRQQTLSWLAAFQDRFSGSLRTPLAASSGVLSADLGRYQAQSVADVCDAARLRAPERIAVYNRQYWFRLLRLLHDELPLTSRLLGLWAFNQVAIRILHAHPPRSADLAAVVEDFTARWQTALGEAPAELASSDARPPHAAVLEAMQLDIAFRRVFLAPEQAPFQLTQADVALAASRLAFSAAYARFEEHWPLMSLRSHVMRDGAQRAVRCPAPLASAQFWALFRTPTGVGKVMLEPAQARLLALLEAEPLGAALARLELETPAADRADLPVRVQGWLGQAARMGFFTRR